MSTPILAARKSRSVTLATPNTPDRFDVFPTELGWMAIVGSGGTLKRLTFGHASPGAARKALSAQAVQNANPPLWNRPLVRRLRAYAAGARDDFRDIEVDPGPLTDFQRRVLECCRRIPYGKTLSYAQLAAKAGSPRAARAVGQCMAANPTPLVIPCHRVVATNGGLGGYSAPGGIRLKRRLLELETSRRASNPT
ncbi:MAG TPA: methylated-DNA--[protein]-cysteine S-methyltransferase [Thermoguttaceae bacterium]|nr:methylated-DNA--[protein]-cysteine S-methyltransferase [Thermoguttaceae bacterium]